MEYDVLQYHFSPPVHHIGLIYSKKLYNRRRFIVHSATRNMNVSILIRTDKELKERFEAQAKRQGLSMTFLLKSFMEAYSEKPEILRVHFDEAALDAYWSSPQAHVSLQKLSEILEKQ